MYHHEVPRCSTSRGRPPCPGAPPRHHPPTYLWNLAGTDEIERIVFTSGWTGPPSVPSIRRFPDASKHPPTISVSPGAPPHRHPPAPWRNRVITDGIERKGEVDEHGDWRSITISSPGPWSMWMTRAEIRRLLRQDRQGLRRAEEGGDAVRPVLHLPWISGFILVG
jgi:hypothetical protein